MSQRRQWESAAGTARKQTTAPALAALVAGALLPLSLAPFDLWPLMVVSSVALFWLLRRTASGGSAFWRGWLFGVGKYGVGASWIYVSIHVHGPTEPPLAVTLVALFVAGMAVLNGVLGWLFHRLRSDPDRSRSILADALAFTILWTALEWMLTWLLTGFPWLFAGYAFLDTPLAGLAPVGGVLLVSFASVLTATFLVATLTSWRWWTLATLAVVWLAAWGLQSIRWTEPGAERISVALVQGNIPQEIKWTPEGARLSRARYQSLSEPHWGRDIVMWPEAALPELRHDVADFVVGLGGQAAADLVLGIVMAERTPAGGIVYYNAAVSTGGGIYRKRRLVPFGDYVPLAGVLRGVIAFFDLPMSNAAAGAERQPLLHGGGLDLAMAICYEIAYPKAVARHARDAAALATVSNDTWFGASIGPLQHLQIARMRALENGKYLLRATNNGVTAIVDPRGIVVARLPQFEAAALTGEIRASAGVTPFAQFLHLPLLLTLLVALLASFAARCTG